MERLRLAAIGVGNRGVTNLAGLRHEEIAVLCDVDLRFLSAMQTRYVDAAPYRDFREALQHADLDGVVISTPDHTHYAIARMAIERGLHVYCEKPLARSIWETRELARLADEHGIVSQMGNQHHHADGYRQVAAIIQSGVLGAVREVHCWTNRPLWPQGIARPTERPAVPDHLQWDLWLGPAPERPYHPIYHPAGWRGWRDFGGGALGDMGPHLLDPVVTSLGLAQPREVIAEYASSTPPEAFPASSRVRYEFAAEQARPALAVTWYDGEQLPPPAVTGVARPPGNGMLFLAEAGRLFAPDLGGRPRLIADRDLGWKEPQLEPRPSHYEEWTNACRSGSPPDCHFAFGARLTELCLLGNLALERPEPVRVADETFPRSSSRPGW